MKNWHNLFLYSYFPILSWLYSNFSITCVVHVYICSSIIDFNLFSGKPRIAKGRDEISSIHMYYRDKLKENVVCVVKFANPRVLTYKWEIQQYSNCKPSECKPINNNWQLVIPSAKSYQINSNSQNSTLTLVQNRKNVFIRCTASNKYGQSNHMWKLIILASK